MLAFLYMLSVKYGLFKKSIKVNFFIILASVYVGNFANIM